LKSVKMSLISRTGQIVNEWSVPFIRRHDALNHAMDRAEQEGHAGILWAVAVAGKIQDIAFDSHDPEAIANFAALTLPYMTNTGLDIDLLLSHLRPGVKAVADKTIRSPRSS
jgi:hypothetical protein